MDLLQGVQLVNKSGKYVLANHALREKKVILFYFAAGCAASAKTFTPYLRQAYEASRVAGQGAGVEVILVSDDGSEEDQLTFLQENCGDWLSVKFLDPVNQRLKNVLDVVGSCVTRIVAADGCSLKISGDGQEAIMEKGAEAFADWERAAAELLDVSAVGILLDNEENVRRQAKEILVKLLSNVEKDPLNVKFRSICVDNKRIKDQLLPARGAWETLIGVGFIQDGDRLVLPLGTSSLKISKYLAALNNLM